MYVEFSSVKAISSAKIRDQDAEKALEYGVDGIIVSNHGTHRPVFFLPSLHADTLYF